MLAALGAFGNFQPAYMRALCDRYCEARITAIGWLSPLDLLSLKLSFGTERSAGNSGNDVLSYLLWTLV